ncbi:MAG: methyltransferase domain-containing protein [Thermodesulfobacteriota bacterium]
MDSTVKCHLCGAGVLEPITGYETLSRVTSDCRPWKKGGRLGVCPTCGGVQKVIDEDFHRECREIYDSYAVYFQGEGEEQRVFEQTAGVSRSRSEAIITGLSAGFEFPLRGRLLDFGCGNGNLLKTFSRLFPDWDLAGAEMNDKHREKVEAVKSGCRFFSCGLEELPGYFDMISLLHTLEHMTAPLEFLTTVRDKLAGPGLLLLELPDWTQNPFDLIIADHAAHFHLPRIESLILRAGFEIVRLEAGLVPKEISVLARKIESRNEDTTLEGLEAISPAPQVQKAINWLHETRRLALRAADRGRLGVFGTSIAGVWLRGELGEAVEFFVDEDRSRAGRLLFGKKVYLPEEVPAGSQVVLALAPQVAAGVWKRMRRIQADFHLPPPWED